jgi:hypothetical protein
LRCAAIISFSHNVMLLSLFAAVSPFIINLAVQGAKYLTGFSSTAGKRFILAVVSLLGAVSFSALSGTPLDINSVSSILQIAGETLIAFFASHGTYTLITGPSVPNA